jgi:hypothetical protein
MERASYLWVLAITILLLRSVTASVVAAGQGKSTHNERGGLSTHSGSSSKGTTNQNAQWSADPEQGWIRSHQNHSMQDRNKSTTSPKSTGGKNNANDKQRKRL